MKHTSLLLYPKQKEFCDSSAWMRGFCAGRGSGKTRIGAIDLLNRARKGRSYLVVAPTYVVMRDATLPMFESVAKEYGRLQTKVNRSAGNMSCDIHTNEGGSAHVDFRSGQEPQTLVGSNRSGVWLDEMTLMKDSVMPYVLPALREGGDLGWVSSTFTPKGPRHWSYHLFFDEAGHPRPNRSLTRAKSADNPFLPAEFVHNMMSIMSSNLAQQELEGMFVDLGGLMFQMDWFPVIDFQDIPHPNKLVNICRYWDKASSVRDGADYTAGVLVAVDEDGIFYVLDVVRGRWNPADRSRVMIETAHKDRDRYTGKVMVMFEQEGGSGGLESAILTQQEMAGFNAYPDKVSGQRHKIIEGESLPGDAKIVRAMPVAAQAEFGNFRMVRGAWNDDFIYEVCSFPNSTHDDQVDALSGAFAKCAPGNIYDVPIQSPTNIPLDTHPDNFGVHKPSDKVPKQFRLKPSRLSGSRFGVHYNQRKDDGSEYESINRGR